MKITIWNELSNSERQASLSRPVSVNSADLQEQVAAIVQQVKTEGDSALISLTQKFDQVSLQELQVSAEEIARAKQNITIEALDAINFAKNQIISYHSQQIAKTQAVETSPGIFCERQTRPIARVGLYVPGGSAPLVSTVLMLAVPAWLAGCPLCVLCTPPNRQGVIDPHILATAELCGIEKIYAVGGAQAIAAMAYGTASIPKVDKIFGPGNSWVTQAKILVAQDPQGASIDMPAGPSELMVIADDSANADFVAADLLSQAEHGPDSQVSLVTTSTQFAEKVITALYQQLPTLLRRTIAEQSLLHARLIVVDDITTALLISNEYAPEHLSLQVNDPDEYIPDIANAGAVFIGTYTPETLGDYVTGSNHVLPTSGYARTTSGLSVVDFMKSISFQTVTQAGLQEVGRAAEILATLEGLDAHKNAVSIRYSTIAESIL